jgi:hypothetical protein
MSKDLIDEVRLLAPMVEPRCKLSRARQLKKLSDAIAAETQQVLRGASNEPKRRVRRWVPVGAAVLGLVVTGGGSPRP